MGGSYRQCPDCGKRALSIATRCPGCGREFSGPAPDAGRPPEPGGRFTPKAPAALLAFVAVLLSAGLGRIGRPADQRAAVESALAATAPPDTVAVGTQPAGVAGELLVARDWTNVRKSRSVRGTLEAMLMPGDTVLADSLERGWYRVALYGEVLGYAHRSTLETPGTHRSPPFDRRSDPRAAISPR